MYQVRLWTNRHARAMERLYNIFNPIILRLLRGTSKIFGHSLDKPVTLIEKATKSLFFDCQMCGNCVLSKTGMSCPMNCPKTIRNGPCGGVRANGMCEVKPKMRCVWVDAWEGSAKMKYGDEIKQVQFSVDHRQSGLSSWLKAARDE